MNDAIYYLTDDPSWFPAPHQALNQPAGLLAVGGDLSPQRVYNAYQCGIFPWFAEGEPLMWWCPDPRAIFDVNQVRCNKSLSKFLRRCDYSVSVNMKFNDVISSCAKPRAADEGTWILPEMVKTYNDLHHKGKAHSIEVWRWHNDQKQLVGGLYGVLVGTCFCGESMFSAQPNASKLALLVLGSLLQNEDAAFIDCQLPNPYLSQMGATLVSRNVFLDKLNNAKSAEMNQDIFKPRMIDWQTRLALWQP